ncbi:unnamed protein product [Caenorhabditis bovis]|uniref:Glutamyl-tRNA(Gln) amidotransferase subunit C, mitochondrial n=1 Tax=Caenorhabditis bovis TaxID=2654633 RepID=A0A8S1ERI5_9PELO|nr:unnamed protein product [Caenorhabditis bovis]
MARKSGLNLDYLFGDVFTNVVGEPITPQKVAIFYLIRQLFRSHFGYRAVPSTRPFSPKQKSKIFMMLYGMAMFPQEMSYNDIRRIVRLMDGDIRRGIYYHFVVSMEQLATGAAHIDLRIEESLYTSKREYHELAMYELPLTKPLMFMNAKCYMFIWIRRLMAQWTKTTQSEVFEISENMKKWLTSGKDDPPILEIRDGIVLPYEIDCSTRARVWISKQLYFLQYLLESVVHVHKKNAPRAVDAMKKFFDLSMFKINSNVVKASQTHRLATLSQKPLRYGPLLQARIYRLFGNKDAAQSLYCESVQQAQLTMDELCNRMANIELSLLEFTDGGPILEKIYYQRPNEIKKDKLAMQQSQSNRECDLMTAKVAPIVQDGEEASELIEQLLSMARVVFAIEDILYCRYCIKSSEHTEAALRIPSVSDHAGKTRQMQDMALAMSTSNLIRNGMYHQAQRVSEGMLTYNFEDDELPEFETESMAVAAVNLAYAHASMGNHNKAFKIIDKIEQKYNPEINWMAARHVKICRLLVTFEQEFLHENLSACESILRLLDSISPIETVLRRALLMAYVGKKNEAIALLRGFDATDSMATLRILMQMASIFTSMRSIGEAEECLNDASALAVNTTLRNVRFMITRRAANILLVKQEPIKALKLLMLIREDVEAFGSIVEKVLYHYAIAVALRKKSKGGAGERKFPIEGDEVLVPDVPYKSKIDEKLLRKVDEFDSKLISHLERLSLVRFDSEQAVANLRNSVKFAQQLELVDVEGVEPMHVVWETLECPVFEDIEENSLPIEEVFRNSPQRFDDFFVTPPGNVPLESKERFDLKMINEWDKIGKPVAPQVKSNKFTENQ